MIKIRKYVGMTLLELMISMAIFSMIMISVMSTVQSMYAARIKAMNRIHLTEQLHTFGEQLFTEIKNGGTLDYEEYWNRTSYDVTTGSGHYIKASGVGNYGTGADWKNKIIEDGSFLGGYFCASLNDNSDRLKVGSGCLNGTSHKVTATGAIISASQKGKMQIYGQYARQFWDYNSNANNDNGDENRDGKIFGDEDDRNNFDGPNAFSDQIHELYLTDEIKKTRTFFRWNIIQDPARNPETEKCEIINNIPNDNCLGNIQILKLEGHDYGYDHSTEPTASGAYDGQVDTWICKDGWDCEGKKINEKEIVATGKNGEWVNLFPTTINVRNFKLEALPNSDPWLSAAKNDCSSTDTSCTSPFIHPYIKISLELGFSHGKRRSIKGDNPVISISTTINLDDFHINY